MDLLLPRYRTWRFPLFNCMRFLSAHFSSLLRSLWIAAWLSGVSCLLPILCHLKICWGYLLPHQPNEGVEQNWTQYWPLGYNAIYWPPTRLSVSDHHPLCLSRKFSSDLAIHSLSPYFISFSVRTLWEIVSKALLKTR